MPNPGNVRRVCTSPKRNLSICARKQETPSKTSYSTKTAYAATMASIPVPAPALMALLGRPVSEALAEALAFKIAPETMLVAAARSD